MIEDIYREILPFLITLITALITWALAELTRYIRSKTRSEVVNHAMDQISEITLNVVTEMEKTVRQALGDGKLTKSEANQIKGEALKRIKAQLPPAVRSTAQSTVNSLDNYLSGKVEEMVTINKKMQKSP